MGTAMAEELTDHPDLSGVFCSNAVTAEQYLNLDKEENMADPKMIGVDATSRQQEAVRSGAEEGIISQNPYQMGYKTMWMAICASDPGWDEYGLEDMLAPMWIDASNIDSEECKEYIYY